MLTIRRTTDARVIASLSRQTFYDTFHKQNTAEDMKLFLEANFNANAIQQEIDDPGNIFIVAEEGDLPLGYAKLSKDVCRIDGDDVMALEICRLYAVKDSIGKGVGKALMQQCLEIARQEQKDVIWLGVWEHNYRAIKFYESFGFQKFSEHVFMLGNDVQNDWLMRREVSF